MGTIRATVEAGDLEAAFELLADGVVLRSPVDPEPYRGKPTVEAIIRGVFRVFREFRYVHEIVSTDGRDQVLIFEATVDGLAATGCDVFHFDEEGKVDTLTVMVRPLPAAHALADAMNKEMRTP